MTRENTADDDAASTGPPAYRQADWEPLRRPAAVAEQMRTLAAEAGPGERLGTKEELRTLWGVSVGTFNEALRMAQSRGVVTVRRGPGGGLFASTPSAVIRLGNAVLSLDQNAEAVAEAVRLRNAVDPLLVRDVLAHATTGDVQALQDAADRMGEAADRGDVDTFLRANWQLHARMAEISPGPILRSLYLGLLEIIDTHTRAAVAAKGVAPREDLLARYQVHADLVAAIAVHDLRALELIERHNTGDPVVEPNDPDRPGPALDHARA
ncbi:FCD domain-containing protein [Amycolatopsis sp. NBC_00345]|uniref:FadR/GntR family transcriptional regulator n=1 Tax=Amycolatopsis sp. NBC_00345 TaxID=2975955 RepID=UPI002E266943